MIKIKCIVDHNKGSYEISIKGHAGYAEHGKDIVCSAVSALFYTYAVAINSYRYLCKNVKITTDGEEKIIRCIPDEGIKHDVSIIFHTISNGLDEIAQQYSKYVTFDLDARW